MTDEKTLLSYEEMLKAGMHFGRKKTVYSPRMEKYVFTVRDGICIIDLLKTQENLGQLIEYLRKTLQDGKLVLFVAPTRQSHDSVKALADAAGMPFVLDRWLGGTLTNFKILNNRVRRLEEMEKEKASGVMDAKYTKKERLLFDRELAKMQNKFSGLKKLTRIPDVVFVSSLKDGHLPVAEAKRMKVHILAIANTDSDPTGIDYVVPANDRSKKAVDLIIDSIKTAITATN